MPNELQVIGVREIIEEPWLAFGVMTLVVRACAMGAIWGYLLTTPIGAALTTIYALTKLAEIVHDERARIVRERLAAQA